MNRLIVFDFNRTLYDPDQRELMSGAIELLQAAHTKGYILVLLGKAAASRAQLLKDLGIGSYFAEIKLVENKTHELFEGFAKTHNADKSQSFVIGDRAQGELKYGHLGGWRTIWLKSGRYANELPAPDQLPDHTVDSLAKVLPLI